MKRLGITTLLLLVMAVSGLTQDYPKADRTQPRSSGGGETETELATWTNLGSRMNLSYVDKGVKYRIFAQDEHGVNSVLVTCKSADLRRLEATLDKSVEKAISLQTGQSTQMGKISLPGGVFHFVAHNDSDSGAWVQITLKDTNRVDKVSFGIFRADDLRGLQGLLGSRHR